MATVKIWIVLRRWRGNLKKKGWHVVDTPANEASARLYETEENEYAEYVVRETTVEVPE